MYLPKTPEREIGALGGEPLEGSGFETEEPQTAFELNGRFEAEGPLQ